MLPSITEIESQLKGSQNEDNPLLRISVLRNIVVEPIEPYLRYLGFLIEHNSETTFGEYDNIFQEAVGGRADLLNENTV